MVAEIARRRHDAAPQVMLPQAVDNYASQQVPRPILGVGKPLGQRHARRAGDLGVAGDFHHPLLIAAFPPGQHLQETG